VFAGAEWRMGFLCIDDAKCVRVNEKKKVRIGG